MFNNINFKKAALILFFICLVTYFNSLSNNFSTDSYYYLYEEYSQSLTSNLSVLTENPRQHQHYNPFDFVFNVVMFKILPPHPIGFRLVNLCIFYAVCLSFFAFLELITNNKKGALLASILYCIHPFNADILNHITLNATYWCTLFMLLSFLTFALSFEKKQKALYFSLSLFFIILALMFFEAALLFPLYIIIFLVTVKRIPFKKAVITSLPFFVVSILHFIVWLTVAGSSSDLLTKMNDLSVSFFSLSASFFHLLKWYIVNAFIPYNVVYMYNFFPLTQNIAIINILGITILAALACLIIFKWKKNIKSFALLWFLIGFLIAVPGMFAHAHMGVIIEPYWFGFSSMGFFLLVALFLIKLENYINKNLWKTLAAVTLLFFFAVTQIQILHGKTEESYAKHWIRIAPNNYLALTSLGRVYANPSQYKKALAYYKRAIDSNLYTSYKIYFNIGMIYFQINDLPEAKKYFKQAIKMNPDSFHAYNALADVLIKENKLAEAIELLERILKTDTLSTERKNSQTKLSVLYLITGDQEKSNQLIERIIQEDPRAETFLLISYTLYDFNLDNTALGILNEAIKIYPEFKEFYLLYGTILANQEDFKKAILVWERGSQLDKKDKRFMDNIKRAKKFMNL